MKQIIVRIDIKNFITNSLLLIDQLILGNTIRRCFVEVYEKLMKVCSEYYSNN